MAAPFDNHANLASSFVATPPVPGTSGTSLTVAPGEGGLFPVPPYNCTVCPANTFPTQANAEIVRVTAKVGDTFTILRAQEGTTAKPIAAGYYFGNSITVKVITDIENLIIGGTVTSVTGTPNEITAAPNTGPVVVSLPTLLTFTGKTVTGGTFVAENLTSKGVLTLDHVGQANGANLIIATDTGQFRSLLFNTGVNTRWAITTNNTAESGSNLGSDFSMSRWSDAGAYIQDVFGIARNSGDTTWYEHTNFFRWNGVGNTPKTSVFLNNETAATAVQPQFSPTLRLKGDVWRTGSGNRAAANWSIQVETSATTNGLSELIFASDISDTPTFARRLTLSNLGADIIGGVGTSLRITNQGNVGCMTATNTTGHSPTNSADIYLGSTPGAMATDDRMGGLVFFGQYTVGGIPTIANAAAIYAYANEAWNASTYGSRIELAVTPNGSTNRSTAVTVTSDGLTVFANTTGFNKRVAISDAPTSTATAYFQSGEPGISANSVIVSNNYFGTSGGSSARRNTTVGGSFLRLGQGAIAFGTIDSAGNIAFPFSLTATGPTIAGDLVVAKTTATATSVTVQNSVGSGQLIYRADGRMELKNLGATVPDLVFNTGLVAASQILFGVNGVQVGAFASTGLTVSASQLMLNGTTSILRSRCLANNQASTACAEAFDAPTSFSGSFLQHYGTAYGGTVAGLSLNNLGVLLFQNTSAGLLTTNNSTPIYFAPGPAVVANFSTLGLNFQGTSIINYGPNGAAIAPPSVGTRSVGTRIVNYASLSATDVDFAIGIEASSQWYSVGTGGAHKWYAGTTNLGFWSNSNLTVQVGDIIANTGRVLNAFSGGSGNYTRSITDTTGAEFHGFYNSGNSIVGSINRVTTTNAVVYNTSSDARLKENVRDFTGTDSGPIIDGLKPRWFDWKEGTDNDSKNIIGFIAQEEFASAPELARIGAVTPGDDKPDLDPKTGKGWMRSDTALIPILVAELKALRQRVAVLESFVSP